MEKRSRNWGTAVQKPANARGIRCQRGEACYLLSKRYSRRRVSGVPNHIIAVGNNGAAPCYSRRTSGQRRSDQNQRTWAGYLRREARIVIQSTVLDECSVSHPTIALHIEAPRV